MRDNFYGRALLRLFGINDNYDGPLLVAREDIKKGQDFWVAKNPMWGEPGEPPLIRVLK